jgi:hypothetical protein
MAKGKAQPSPNTMATHPPQQQESRYGMMHPPGPQTHSAMPPPPSPSPSPKYQPSPFTLPTQLSQATPQNPAPAATQTSADTLEQRVLDLLYPYRDECFSDEGGTTVGEERMALMLCGMFPARTFHFHSHALLH